MSEQTNAKIVLKGIRNMLADSVKKSMTAMFQPLRHGLRNADGRKKSQTGAVMEADFPFLPAGENDIDQKK
ncbi:hypothetical protein [Pedobacter namyangjuensis]|uniref:hypothetical protein n=1 Tax=Pedobacter namyangjuensis TaxID=600626 RepID=UPI000DE1D7F6|nr:hypothetical protein [Pedobacter namyangjuensis]